MWKCDIFRQFSNSVLIIKPQLWRASYESFIHCFAMQPNPIFHHLVRRSQKPQKIQFWLNFACDINHYYCSCHTGVEVYCRDKYQRVFSKYFYPCRKASACDWREEKMSVLCALKKTVRPLTLYKKCAPIWNVLKRAEIYGSVRDWYRSDKMSWNYRPEIFALTAKLFLSDAQNF